MKESFSILIMHKIYSTKKFGHSQKNDVCGKCLSSTPALYRRCQSYKSPFNFDTYKRTPVYRCRDCGCITSLLDRSRNCSECHSSDVKILTGRDWEIRIEDNDLEEMLDDGDAPAKEMRYLIGVDEWKKSICRRYPF